MQAQFIKAHKNHKKLKEKKNLNLLLHKVYMRQMKVIGSVNREGRYREALVWLFIKNGYLNGVKVGLEQTCPQGDV